MPRGRHNGRFRLSPVYGKTPLVYLAFLSISGNLMLNFLNFTINFLFGLIVVPLSLLVAVAIVLLITRRKRFYLLIWLPTFLGSILITFLGGTILWHKYAPTIASGRGAEPSIIEIFFYVTNLAKIAMGAEAVAVGVVLFTFTCLVYPRAHALSASYVALATFLCLLTICILTTVGVYTLPRIQPYLFRDVQKAVIAQGILERVREVSPETEDPTVILTFLTRIGTFKIPPNFHPIFALNIGDFGTGEPIRTAVLLGPAGSRKADILERSDSVSYRVKAIPQGRTYVVVARSHQGIRPKGIGYESHPADAVFEATSSQLRPLAFESHGVHYEGFTEHRTNGDFVITIVEVDNFLTIAAFGADETTTQNAIGEILSGYKP